MLWDGLLFFQLLSATALGLFFGVIENDHNYFIASIASYGLIIVLIGLLGA